MPTLLGWVLLVDCEFYELAGSHSICSCLICHTPRILIIIVQLLPFHVIVGTWQY